jgi:tetratricopeptide (TPR) repeat protein
LVIPETEGDEMKRRKWLIVVLILGGFSLAVTPGWPEEDSLRKAEELYHEITRHYQQGRYADALPLAERELEIIEKTLGPEHPSTAISVNNLAELYRVMGAYDKALPGDPRESPGAGTSRHRHLPEQPGCALYEHERL